MRLLLLMTPYGDVHAEPCLEQQKWFLHFEYTKLSFSKKDYLGILDAWVQVQETMKSYGIQEVYTGIPEEDTKNLKFNATLGLEVIGTTNGVVIHKGVL